MLHNQTVLGCLLKGKNLDNFLKRNRVVFSGVFGKNSKNGVISKFELSPVKVQRRIQNTLICDSDITSILETSTKTLTYCNLVSCLFITDKTFKALAKASNLQWLTLSNSSNLLDSSAILILQGCRGLLHLNFSRCPRLTSSTTEAITSNLHDLETLNISHNSGMLAPFLPQISSKFGNLSKLRSLSVAWTSVSDTLLTAIVESTDIDCLDVAGCVKLTAEGVGIMVMKMKNCVKKVNLAKTGINKGQLEHIEEWGKRGDGKVEFGF